MSNDKMSLSERYNRLYGIQQFPSALSRSDKTMGERFKDVNDQLNCQPHIPKRPRKGDIPPENIDDLIEVYAGISLYNNLGNLRAFLVSCQIKPSGIYAYSKSSDGKNKSHKVTERTIERLFGLFKIPYHEEAAAQLLKNIRAMLLRVSNNKFLTILNELITEKALELHLTSSYSFYDKYLIYYDSQSNTHMSAFQLYEYLKNNPYVENSNIKKIINALYNRFIESERLIPAPGHCELEQLHSNSNYKAVFCLEHQNYVLEVEEHEEKTPESNVEEIVDTVKTQAEEGTEGTAKETSEIQAEVVAESSSEEKAKKKKRKKRNISYTIALKKLPPLPHHSIKKLPLENYKQQYGNNSRIALFLEAIAGSVEAADRLAMLFADIAVPGSSKHSMSVIHTSCNEVLILKLLKSVFMIDPTEEPAFINTSFSPEGKRSLLDKHIKGVPLILFKDTPPNYNNIQNFAQLMSGKKISVNIDPYPNQHFYSHFHMVCITSQQKVVNKFAELGANVVTLEPKPLASELSYILFNTDIIWLRTAFLLHGCRLRYIERKSNRHKPQITIHSSRIFEFFIGQCEIAEGQKIERSEMYNAYCDYHKAAYGCEPTENSFVFIREIKKLLSSDVTYKVSRYGEDKKTHMCFIGLRLKQVPVTEKIYTSEFCDYLEQIEQYADSLVSKIKDPKKIFRVEAK